MTELIVLCAVCFKGSDPVMAGSLNAGILVLLATTAGVLGCFGCFFVRLARRARDAGEVPDGEPPFQHRFGVEPGPGGVR